MRKMQGKRGERQREQEEEGKTVRLKWEKNIQLLTGRGGRTEEWAKSD